MAPQPTDPRAVIARETERVVDRLRQLSVERLAQPATPWHSRFEAAYAVATALADAAQDIEERDGPPPVRRTLPRLSAHAAGHLLAVTAADLLWALDGVADEAPTWAAGHRAAAGEVAQRAADALTALRRAI